MGRRERNKATVGWCIALMSAGVLLPAGARAAAPSYPDPAPIMQRIAAEPFRYGGALQGTIPVETTTDGQPALAPEPVHLAVGLSGVGPDGRIAGEAILFTADRHYVASGPVSGHMEAGWSAATATCQLSLALPGRSVKLDGICTPTGLSGEIVSNPEHVGFLTRIVTWWGDRAVAGRYWLTPDSFDPAQPGSGIASSL